MAEPSGEALADGVERLMQHDLKAVGEAGRATALRMFPFEVMWLGTMELYQRALARKR
ncbi:MAG: hypothetical protein IPN44_08880 [Flavobacteriales bacterium]|nr:hypothetical protein [Flavobacteriales bacterium]